VTETPLRRALDRLTQPPGVWRRLPPGEAVAELAEAGVVPEHWCDPARSPAWVCPDCEGAGCHPAATGPADGRPYIYDQSAAPVNRCGGAGILPLPWCAGALVSVAALGRDAVVRAELVAAERWPRRRLAWVALLPHQTAPLREGRAFFSLRQPYPGDVVPDARAERDLTALGAFALWEDGAAVAVGVPWASW